MVSEIVVGTLTTLNTIVSPLGPGTPGQLASYQFSLQPNSLLQQNCHIAGPSPAPQHSVVNLSLGDVKEKYFTIQLDGLLCTSSSQMKQTHTRLNLPSELLDQAFLRRLPTDRGYVVSGIPTANNPTSKPRVKIAHLESGPEFILVQVDWIPEGSEPAAHPPLKIWIGQTREVFSGVKGYTARSLPWKRIKTSYQLPANTKKASGSGNASGKVIAIDGKLRNISGKN